MKHIKLFLIPLIALIAGFLLRGFFTGISGDQASSTQQGAVEKEVWTCSMHPQIRLPNSGMCPICEMPLIVTATGKIGSDGKPLLELSDHALAMASVETSPVIRKALFRELRAVGKIQYNETSLATITARIDGYAERLFVNFTGGEIKSGDPLVEVYSPDLLAAQQELITALQSKSGALVEMVKAKLQRWGLTEKQIDQLAGTGILNDRMTLYSPIQGTVIEKVIVQNSPIKTGDILYRIANLDTVWVYLDIYEADLPRIDNGQQVEISAEALPGSTFKGEVTFIQPFVNEETRTIRVPVRVENAKHELKPGMFISAVIKSALEDPERDKLAGLKGKFFCPMKCEGEKVYDGAGNCPVCEMKLNPVPTDVGTGVLAVPASAVLDSGTRRIVYVEKSRGLFEAREVVLGPRSDGFFQVISGVDGGERVVTRGGFLIDSQFQITGRPSLFYPGGLMDDSSGHQH